MLHRFLRGLASCVSGVALTVSPAAGQDRFVQWESPHVHPLDATPDGARLLAVNTAAATLEVFDLGSGLPMALGSIPVGLDPISVRARSEDEVWVVNRISDSVSIVNLRTRNVTATLVTDDEPSDVVFAGARAFVTCSQANTILVFELEDLDHTPTRIPIDGECPRALAVSPDGTRVFAAIFESGNRSTVLGGGALFNIDFPPNVVSSPFGPYAGRNPPPNSADEGGFRPARAADADPAPKVGLIVKQDAAGRWRDDFQGDWTHLVSGPHAARSGRVEGWELADHDVAVIDARTLAVTYVRGLMNTCMALAVNPKTGAVTVVGTDATNEVRFEPNLRGRFLRVLAAEIGADASVHGVTDLNPQLDYAESSIPRAERSRAIGDPRGIAWEPDGERGWIAGMGSNNVVAVDAHGASKPDRTPIETGDGPTGIVFDARRGQVYVLCKNEGAISVLGVETRAERARVPFLDPTPRLVRKGRRHLYGTHETSGLGQASCASCHVDARTDHLAWDLGDPSGKTQPLDDRNLGAKNPSLLESLVPGRGAFEPYHAMKGPMTTQTLQDIVGHEPLHWRGDRAGLESFRGAFRTLLGADDDLGAREMEELKAFLATIALPPNPFRNEDNTLPEDLPLSGHVATGRFGPAGRPLPNGNARRGLGRFRTGHLDNTKVQCVTCHALPTGTGTDFELVDGEYRRLAAGPLAERHHMLVAQDGSTNVSMKVPQLRTLYDKVGFDLSRRQSHFGFGFLHDGSVDTLARFVNETSFSLASDQDTADIVAFLLAFSGSDLPAGATDELEEPPGTLSLDTHAAVGRQRTFARPASEVERAWVERMLALARAGRVGVIAKTIDEGGPRGFAYLASGAWRGDREGEVLATDELLGRAAPGRELTLTVVVAGTERRLGIDRDADGVLDGAE